jgi:hypothetical protein
MSVSCFYKKPKLSEVTQYFDFESGLMIKSIYVFKFCFNLDFCHAFNIKFVVSAVKKTSGIFDKIQ